VVVSYDGKSRTLSWAHLYPQVASLDTWILASISPVQVRILKSKSEQIQKTEIKIPDPIPRSLGDSSAFSWFRIWDLFRISSFGFRISEPTGVSSTQFAGKVSLGEEGRGEGEPLSRVHA